MDPIICDEDEIKSNRTIKRLRKRTGRKIKTSPGNHQRCRHHRICPRGARQIPLAVATAAGSIRAVADATTATGGIEKRGGGGSRRCQMRPRSPPRTTDPPADAADTVIAVDAAVGTAPPNLEGGEGAVVKRDGRPSRSMGRGRGEGTAVAAVSAVPAFFAPCRRDGRDWGRGSGAPGWERGGEGKRHRWKLIK
uniref:DUF834 domain-containing protein n=1 Tax=Oryza barthii TaxID=65489 RepID=A0A0D3EPK7_9ORYZ